MEYYMTQLDSSEFYIDKEKIDKAFKALLNYMEKKAKDDFRSFDREKYEDFEDAIEELGWSVTNPYHLDYINCLDFNNDALGDEFTWMKAIAPYVGKGSHIDMMGDDQHFWSWYFNGKTMKTYEGKLTYPGRPDLEVA